MNRDCTLDNGTIYVKKNISLWIGILSFLLGITCIITKDKSLCVLKDLFLIIFFIGGISELRFSLSNKYMHGWGWSLAGGIMDILFVMLMLHLNQNLDQSFVYIIGGWTALRSILNLGLAFEFKEIGVNNGGFMIALLVLSILFSFLYILSPAFYPIHVKALLSFSFFSYGLYRIVLYFNVNNKDCGSNEQ